MPTYTLSEQALIDRVIGAERKLTRAAINAIVASRDAPGTLRQVAALIQTGRIEDAIEAAARAGAVDMARASAAVYVESGIATSTWLSTVLAVTVDFDQVHDFAVDRIRQNRLQLVRDWTDAQRGAARVALEEGIERGFNPIEQARAFRQSTGLTAHQERIVRNYESVLQNAHNRDVDGLMNELRDGRRLRDARFDPTVRRAARESTPLTRQQIDRMVERYRARSIKRRAETIARTEALRSVNAGSHDAMRQAIDGRHIRDDEVTRTWVATNDLRTRPDHVEANGQQVVGINTPFLVGGHALIFPGDPSGPPEQVISCRCSHTVRLTTP